MKKTVLSTGIFLAMMSCNTHKNAGNNTTTNTPTAETVRRSDLKGDWKLVSVNYDSRKFKVKPFGENLDAQCFVGSEWKLIPNNGKGSYTLMGGEQCAAFTQNIIFSVDKNNNFSFKKLQDNVKAKQITAGYILQLKNQQQDRFTLVQDVPFEGQMLRINYQFQKKSTK